MTLAIAAAIACGPAVAVDHGGGTSTGAADGSSAGTSGDPSTTLTSVEPTTATTEATAADASSGDGGGGSTNAATDHGAFIDEPDGGGTGVECDVWVDDCPPGQKCMPWANDGGNSWNATKCSPLVDDPHQVGEPCTVEGNGVSGLDDCEAHAMCWNVDPETNEGTCVAFCTGSEANPTCGDPCTPCSVWNDGVLILCLPICDPLAQDCEEGNGCWPTYDGSFLCMPDSSAEMGALGDACEFLNVCDPGLFCAPADRLPNCAGPVGCCSAFCDVSAADPCPDKIAGTECVPWYDEGEAPPCFAHVIGGCLLPE